MQQRDFVAADKALSSLVADRPGEAGAWLKLVAVRRVRGDLEGALTAAAGALRIDPLAFMPLLLKGNLLEALGRTAAAHQAYGAALFHCPPEASLDPMWRTQVARVRAAHEAHQDGLDRALRAAMAEPEDPATARRLDRFRTNILRRTRTYHQEPSHFHYPGLPEIEFLDAAAFPGIAALEAATDAIRAEFEAVVAAEAAELVPYIAYPEDVPLAQWAELNRSSRWTAIHLIRNGEVIEANAGHCPRTLACFAALPQFGVPGFGPNLMFSLLAAGTRIPAHTGVANPRVVLHLPLIVPPGCGFRVGAETRDWVPGEAFVFDDTIEHEAWNDSDRLRVVLIGDLWNPSLSDGERSAIGRALTAAAEIVE